MSENMFPSAKTLYRMASVGSQSELAAPSGSVNLPDCPFCGGRAELDAHQGYRTLSGGYLGSAVAIYCVGCGVQISLCREDLPECDTDELVEMVSDLWRKRHPQNTV